MTSTAVDPVGVGDYDALVIVVHGWWSLPSHPGDEGSLVLWAEDALASVEGRRGPGRKPRVRQHPFSVEGEELARALGLGDAPVASAQLTLPGYTHAPAASPELLDLHSSSRDFSEGETVRLRPDVFWRVPTVTVDAQSAVRLLSWLALDDTGVIDSSLAPDGIGPVGRSVMGADLRGVTRLAEFAVDLASRGRVLPVALPGPVGQGLARWRPVLTGSDAEWFRSLVAAFPPSYRAALADEGPGRSAAAALDSLVDAAVRDRLGPAPRAKTGVNGLAGWRRALRGTDPGFEATQRQFALLAGDLARWQADALGGGVVRACFRLIEPTDDDEASVLRRPGEPVRSAHESQYWRLEFGLQLTDEPSRVVLAREIWEGGPVQFLARHTTRPQESLLAELGRALRLFPELSGALAGPKPAELLLDTNEAHAFLAQTAPLLIGAGFGVLLPGWWGNPRARLGARLSAGTPSQPGRVEGVPQVGQSVLVEFDWKLSIGDEMLSRQEVDALIERQHSLVKVRGEWLQVDTERLRKARDFLRRRTRAGREGMTVGEVLRVLGSLDEGPGGLPVTGVDAVGWLGDLLSPEAEATLQPVDTPKGFEGTLRPYQERGLAWLAFLESVGMGALLADDMGLGKTIQLLALIAHDRELADEAGPTLLVCPTSLVGNWEREAARFTPHLRVHVHHGKDRPTGDAFADAIAASDLIVTTYPLLARDVVPFRSLRWRRVVLDEAQAVKNAATQAATAARSLKTDRRIAVTGTPVENRLADLWSLMEFANPKLLGDATEFKRRFALPIERVGDAEAGHRLRALTQPFILRRVKTDASIISDLPEKLEMEVVCSLTAEQAGLYQGVVAEMLAKIGDSSGIERRGLVLAAMTKLKQVCNHPAQFLRDGSRVAGRSGKLARLEETLEEVLAAGEKVLIFTQYAEFGEMLRTHLTARFGREVAFLHGGVGRAQRDEMVARFQSGDRTAPSMFVLSLKAGGTGLTLTAANHVIHIDRWWNPAVEDQATDRAFRIGQSKSVQVRKFVTAGTLEEKISAMIQDKRGLAASVVGTGEGWLTELSTSQLRDLFTLQAGAVV